MSCELRHTNFLLFSPPLFFEHLLFFRPPPVMTNQPRVDSVLMVACPCCGTAVGCNSFSDTAKVRCPGCGTALMMRVSLNVTVLPAVETTPPVRRRNKHFSASRHPSNQIRQFGQANR